MFVKEVLIALLLPQLGRTIFSNTVPPWSCTTNNSFPRNVCLNERTNHSPLLHENYGSLIGGGFSGAVRLFATPIRGDPVAVKSYGEPYPDESEEHYISAIRYEYSIADRLSHRNIIATYDLYTDGTNWHQIMEYCPFELQQVVESCKLQQNEVDWIFREIVEGVAYMHGIGVAHLDLKLTNVMLATDGTPKIIDFGSSVSFHSQRNSPTTLTEGVRGALPFLAPEILAHSLYDAEMADMWALGIIYVCMTLSCCPWLAPSEWDQSFRLFLAADNSSMSDIHRYPPPELSSQGEVHVSRGPESLLQLLPQASRKMIGRILDLRPESRATMEDLRSDEWFKGISPCSEGGCLEICSDMPSTMEEERTEKTERLNYGYALYLQ